MDVYCAMGSTQAFSMPLGTHLMSTGSLIHQYIKTGYLSGKKKSSHMTSLAKVVSSVLGSHYACIIRDWHDQQQLIHTATLWASILRQGYFIGVSW